jgi:hypothetical protein
VFSTVKTDRGKELVRAGELVEFSRAWEYWRRDVVDAGECGQEVGALEDESDRPPVAGLLASRHSSYLAPTYADPAFIGSIHHSDQMKQRRLTRAGRTDNCDDVSGVD